MITVLHSVGNFEDFEEDVIRALTDHWSDVTEAERNIYGEIIQWGIEDDNFNIEEIGLSIVTNNFDLFNYLGNF